MKARDPKVDGHILREVELAAYPTRGSFSGMFTANSMNCLNEALGFALPHCALLTDGRFSGGTSGLSIGHASPEAAAGGLIALVQDGDPIEISIPVRLIILAVSDDELERRRRAEESWGDAAYTARERTREVSTALRAYAFFAESADKGAVRRVP